LRELSMRLHLPLIMAQIGDAVTADVLRTSVREHRAIARAILEQDAAMAVAAMRAHLGRAGSFAIDCEAMSGEDEPAMADKPAI